MVTATIMRSTDVDWAKLYDAQRDRLRAIARVIIGSEEDAADVVQTAFERAYRHRRRLDASRAPEAWLTRIACNEAISAARRRRVLRWVPLKPDEPDSIVDRSLTDRIAVGEAIRRLTAKHRAVIALFYLCGYSLDESAEILGIPRGTVASRLNHARNVLREMLADNL